MNFRPRLCWPALVPLFAVAAWAQAAVSAPAAVTPFVPGAIASPAPNNASPAFSRDGADVVFTAMSADSSSYILMAAHRAAEGWSAPQPVPFSGHYRDLEAAFAPDGRFLVFASNRPDREGGDLLTGRYNGRVLPGRGGHLWRVSFGPRGWGKPALLPVDINRNSSVYSPAVSGDGSLYFMRADDGQSFHILRSQYAHGRYLPPERAAFSRTQYGDFDPAVAADESYLIFSSPRPPAPAKTTDLFIVFRTAGGWSEPLDLRQAVAPEVYGIEARLSPDGRTLYFTHAGPDHISRIWQVDIGGLLARHRAGPAPRP